MEQNNSKGSLCQRKLIICRGIQGSGKSTWAKQWCHEDPENRIRFNNDDIRNMLGDYWVPSRENVVLDLKKSFLYSAMSYKYDIVIDNMNLNPKEIKFYEDLVEDWNNPKGIIPAVVRPEYKIEFKDFFIPVEECIHRDAMRPNPIGEKVIRDTWKRYRDFIIHEEVMRVVDNTNKTKDSYSHYKKKAIIVDMDSTLCFNTTKRPFWER